MEAKRDAPAPPPDSLPPGDRGCRTLAPARTPRARGAGRAAGADVDGSPCSLSGRAAAAGRGAASSCASSARTARSSRSSFGCSCSSVPTCARRARRFPGHASRPVELSCMSASGLQRTAHGCKRTCLCWTTGTVQARVAVQFTSFTRSRPGQGLGPAPRTAGRKFIAESGAGGTPLRASAFDSLDSSLAAVRGGALAAPGPPAASGCGSACGAGAPGGCGTACSGALHGSALAEYHWTIVKAVR